MVGLAELANIDFMDCSHPELYLSKLDITARLQRMGLKYQLENIWPSLCLAIRNRIVRKS
jgi:hypothetical protein